MVAEPRRSDWFGKERDESGQSCEGWSMSKATWSVTAVVLVTGATAVFLQHRDNLGLRRELAQLRDEMRTQGSRAAAAVPVESPRVTANTSEAMKPMDGSDLAALRQEITALRRSTQELTQFAQAAQAAAAVKSMSGTESSVATKIVPVEALRNAGRATPEAATETVLWAAAGGDVDTLSNSLVFTPTAREKADAWFASLSDGTRQQYGSPEKIMSLMIAKEAAGLSGMQVVGQKEIMADNVAMRVRFASTDGKTKDDNLVLRRDSSGWRMVLPDNAVEKFARQLHGGK